MWCKTQTVAALSSAEAELYGLVRASAETMGLTSLYKDLGTHMNGVVLGDASAALAIVARWRLGKLRHLDTNYLWKHQEVIWMPREWLGLTIKMTYSRKP